MNLQDFQSGMSGWANLTASTPETRTTLGESDRARRTDDKIWAGDHEACCRRVSGWRSSLQSSQMTEGELAAGGFTAKQSGEYSITESSSLKGLAVTELTAGGLHCKAVRSLIQTVRNTSPEATIIVSGPLPTYRQGQESDACGETTLPEDVIISGFIQSGTDTTPWITQRKTQARTRARTSPPPLPVFEISTWNHFSPLHDSERGDAMIRHVRATSGKDKVCAHCFPRAHVLDVAAQVPEILNGDERVGAVVLNVGANDNRRRRDLGCIVLMAESERLFCRTTSPRRYTPNDYDSCGETTLPVSCWIGGQRLKHRGCDHLWLHSLRHGQHHGSHSGRHEPGPELEPIRRPYRSSRFRPGTASPLFRSRNTTMP
ncbi:hypothetical protein F2P79_019157 [Pimephales promelas]|nr:hypothetical protein F2P79_019157 [Pimephales promelas]